MQNGALKVLIPVVAIVVLVVVGLFAIRSRMSRQGNAPTAQSDNSGTGAAPVAADLRVGATLPDFELHSFKANKSFPVSELKSKVSLINFWATWCEACMVEMPSIIKLYNGYKDKGLDVVAVDLDSNPESVLPRAIQKMGMAFNVYTDQDSKLADLFQIQAIPLTVVIDRNRKILMIENNERDWDGADFHADLEKWLAG